MRLLRYLHHRLSKPRSAVFQGFWHGPPLGQLRSACLASFIERGHKFELYSYDDVSVPSGVVMKDASEIIPRSEMFYFINPKTGANDLGPFSDLFRFKLLFERGGWWSDVDTVCLSDSIPALERAWAQEKPEYNLNAIGTSQLAFPRADPLAGELYHKCLLMSKTEYPYRESLGPLLISSTIIENGLPKNYGGLPNSFYPIRWIEMFKLWLPEYCHEIERRVASAFFLPIYQSFPQYIGLSLGRRPPRGSYLAKFLDRHCPAGENGAYEADEIISASRQFFLSNDWAINELTSVAGAQALTQLGIEWQGR
jgi:hypothetical protein